MNKTKLWDWDVGERKTRVRVYERADKDNTLHLYWWQDGKQRQVSLGKKLRNQRGVIDRATARWAQQQCRAKHEELTALRLGVSPSALPVQNRRGYTVADAIRDVPDSDRGLYPHDTPHRREAIRALKYAERLWGSARTWNTIGREELREIGRRRVRELIAAGCRGHRGAESFVSRILAIAQWLRENGKIHDTSCVPVRRWKRELKDFWKGESGARLAYEPDQPRHNLKDVPTTVDHSWHVDPRFGLMMELGFSLRLGQVRRVRRSDLDLQAGTLTVHGNGAKRGTVFQLSDAQRVAVEKALRGYLRVLEANQPDYHLFPGGRLRKGVAYRDTPTPCSRGVVNKWFRLAEKLAGIDHVPGRSAYGLRRISVDGAEEGGVSDEALKIMGGWENIETPKNVYASKRPAWAMKESAEMLDRIRRGTSSKPPQSITQP